MRQGGLALYFFVNIIDYVKTRPCGNFANDHQIKNLPVRGGFIIF
jgi:hypothetical protein